MPIKVACKCGQSFAAKDELAGKTVKCPKCASPITIPAPRAAAPQRPANQPAAPAKRPAAPAKRPAAPAAPSGLADLLAEEGFEGHAGMRCVKCNTPLPAGAVVCTKCGFNAQTGQSTQSNVRIRNLGHGEAAEDVLARASKEIAATPIQMDSNDFGDAKSIWTWVMLPFLPLLVILGFGVVIIWGGLISGPIIGFWNGLMNGQYELLIPALLGFFGALLMMVGWFGVSSVALESSVVQGIASLITLGLYTPIYGTAHYRTCKYQMEMYWYGVWFLNAGLVAMVAIAGFYEKMPLMIVPISIYYVGVFLNWFGFYRVMLAAFDESAKAGYLSMFVPFYVLVYGATRWSNNKTNMIVGIVGIGITILALIIGGVMLSSSTIHLPKFEGMFPAAQPS